MAERIEGHLATMSRCAFGMLVTLLSLATCGCGGSKSTAEWIELSKSKDSAERIRAIGALAEKKSEAEAVIPALIEALKDSNAFARRDAARALGSFGAAASVAASALQLAARDKNEHVRQAAKDALLRIAPNSPPEPKKK